MKVGDLICITTTAGTFEGILLPEEKNILVLKLASGYNIRFNKKNVKKTRLLKEKPYKKPTYPLLPKNNLPRIVILHTGGTIASKVDYETGGVIARFEPEELVAQFPELSRIATIESRFIANMWSEDMRFSHYNIIAQAVNAEITKNCAGIIIAHGTDTLHYSAAALSFMFENLPIPVLLVGAQRSSDRPSSDSGVNLACATHFITHTNFAGVAICMHENLSDEYCTILPGTNSRKLHSSRRDAFSCVNTTPIARVNYFTKTIEFQTTNYLQKSDQKPTLKLLNEKLKIGLLKIHPNMFANEFTFYKNYQGLVIEGLGLAGNIPINEIDSHTKEHRAIAKAITILTKKGIIVAATTQTIYGRINMNVYSTGRTMQTLGIIGNYTDMTTETAYLKLAFLLSNYPKKEIPSLYLQNLCGEISQRELP